MVDHNRQDQWRLNLVIAVPQPISGIRHTPPWHLGMSGPQRRIDMATGFRNDFDTALHSAAQHPVCPQIGFASANHGGIDG